MTVAPHTGHAEALSMLKVSCMLHISLAWHANCASGSSGNGCSTNLPELGACTLVSGCMYQQPYTNMHHAYYAVVHTAGNVQQPIRGQKARGLKAMANADP
jgi:hypothetical protein